jgi:hypothetical protein
MIANQEDSVALQLLSSKNAPDIIGPWFNYNSNKSSFSAFITPFLSNKFTILLLKPELVESSTDWLNWARPFTGLTWVLVLAIIVVTGVAVWFFERSDEADEDFTGKSNLEGMATGLAISAETFTGAGFRGGKCS